ncbi:MAG: hypothetical protein GX886_08545 [Comamonadaceae bacterium]|nr:hypothetical protein [Rubrivivax sp.]NLZ41287.1 hypothetical protein [Comamonadaceae bacterium]
MSVETLLAAVGLALCLVLLARMALGARRRARLDALVQRAARGLEHRVRSRWRRHRLHGQAAREARAAIERARRARHGVAREGQIHRPRSLERDGSDAAPDGRHRKDH